MPRRWLVRTLMIATLLLAVLVAPACRASDSMACLKQVDVAIKMLNPPIHFSTDPKRNEKITLRMPVDCKNEQLLKPTSFPQAEEWLDMALPLDFKDGMAGGDYLNPYMYTLYGASVEDQLYNYFTESWQLSATSPACKNAPMDPAIEPAGNTCFYQIIDDLRTKYKRPVPVIPEHKS